MFFKQKEYKAPDTRIRVVKSSVKAEYWPEYKNCFGFYETFCSLSTEVLRSSRKEPGSLEFAQSVIDLHHELAERTYNNKQKRRKHNKEQEVSYIKYP